MQKKKNKTFHYASIALNILERVLGSKFSVNGIENLPNQPILFVANHFTRSETFFVPYLIHKHTNRQIRCLADASLFHGLLGKFLRSTGTVSTKNPKRDNIILKDLMSGQYDWMIYPEGSMIKSKEIRKGVGFVNHTPERIGRARTGSSILALKSELYRKNLTEAFENDNSDLLQDLEKNLGLKYQESFKDKNTHIVPLNITYYPIRPGSNKIKSLAAKLVKKIPKQIAEEIEIEGNLLLSAEINISFGKAINVADYIRKERSLVDKIPIIKQETKNNFIFKYFKYRLTVDFMRKIYSDVQINFDHLFSAALYHMPKDEVTIDHLKRIIYASATTIKKHGKYRLNSSIFEENLFNIFADEPYEEFDSVFKLAKDQGLITECDGERIKINNPHFHKECDFHEIRRENTLAVVVNEFLLLEAANNIVKINVKISDAKLKKRVFEEIRKRDLEIFEIDYERYFNKKFSKDKSVGAPFFMDSPAKTGSKIGAKLQEAKFQEVGILLCHGYKSSPKEVEALAEFLNGLGFKIYAVRLSGHGTAPINMKDVTWQDWYSSLQRGYAALNNICSKIIIIGFSTGGLLALLSCAKKKTDSRKKIGGIVAINAALKLQDIKTKMVPGINIWNEMLDKLNIDIGKLEYVDDEPENPKINYKRNYLIAVQQLGELMEECKKNLDKISAPTLVIQAKHDPVVNPSSGKLIYKNIKSKNKFLFEPNFSNHVIVNGKNKEEVFESVRDFLYQLANSSVH